MTSWLNEIDLDPSDPPIRMGVRTLGDRPWLVQDENEKSELELKANLTRDDSSEVFLALPGSEAAGKEVCSLITADGRQLISNEEGLHPLEIHSRRFCLCNAKKTAAAGRPCFSFSMRLPKNRRE